MVHLQMLINFFWVCVPVKNILQVCKNAGTNEAWGTVIFLKKQHKKNSSKTGCKTSLQNCVKLQCKDVNAKKKEKGKEGRKDKVAYVPNQHIMKAYKTSSDKKSILSWLEN